MYISFHTNYYLPVILYVFYVMNMTLNMSEVKRKQVFDYTRFVLVHIISIYNVAFSLIWYLFMDTFAISNDY